MYERGPSEAELAAFGMTCADIPQQRLELWPDAWPAFRLFEALSTQWRIGMGGASGLDYSAIPVTASMLGIRHRELPALFADLRILEIEALAIMAESDN